MDGKERPLVKRRISVIKALTFVPCVLLGYQHWSQLTLPLLPRRKCHLRLHLLHQNKNLMKNPALGEISLRVISLLVWGPAAAETVSFIHQKFIKYERKVLRRWKNSVECRNLPRSSVNISRQCQASAGSFSPLQLSCNDPEAQKMEQTFSLYSISYTHFGMGWVTAEASHPPRSCKHCCCIFHTSAEQVQDHKWEVSWNLKQSQTESPRPESFS